MRTCVAHLKSVSAYSQSKYIQTPKKDKELAKNHEERTWRERCHVDPSGHIFIPSTAFKNCVSDAAKYLSIKIPGKGNQTYTKHFEAGVMVMDPLVLPIKLKEVTGEWLFVPSDGKRGGAKRVMKCFPLIPSWEGEVTYYVLDETITADVFEQHLEQAGKFIGIGRFRPRNNGFYGRFKVVKCTWSD